VLRRVPTSNPNSPLRSDLLWLASLVLALVCAQSLGFMHRVMHTRAAAPVVASDTVLTPAAPIAAHATSERQQKNWPAALFSGHDGQTTCPLFDGVAGQAIALTAPFEFAVAVLANEQLRWLAAEFIARWAAIFQARGPPDFR
jgi:hypothetical protein